MLSGMIMGNSIEGCFVMRFAAGAVVKPQPVYSNLVLKAASKITWQGFCS